MKTKTSGHPGALGPTTAGIPKTLRRIRNSTSPKAAVLATAAPSTAFSFALKPRDVVRHLDRFVIGQAEAKKVLAVALCDHFQHVRLSLAGSEAPFYQKQNILIVGPTGVGKTHLIRSAADLIGVPFVKADATKFSETGYVGGDVDDLVRDLVRRAGGDVQRAQYGIIYLDEVDKLASQGASGGRDVSGRGVQTNLLKLMEDGDVPLISPNDVTSQMQAAVSAARGQSQAAPDTVSTKNILIIASGAFSGMATMIRKRLDTKGRTCPKSEDDVLQQATTADFTLYGLEPEFVGRLPVRVACHSLDADDLFHVLRKSESSLIRQYERAFLAYGITIEFQDAALRHLARLAGEEQTGARALMTVLERTFRDIKYRLPSTPLRKLVITEELVSDPKKSLAVLLKSQRA